MRDWISRKALAMGGQIDGPAAQALVAQVGNDTLAARQALEKLLLYINYERPIDTIDVQELISGSASASVFDMVDALAVGNAREAFRTLEILLEDQEVPALFAMIVRQFRLLIQTREILDQRGGAALVQQELNQVPFVADKLCRQAAGFTLNQLRNIYQQLVEMDFAAKTSQSDPRTALNVLIAEVSLMVKG
jgi:DNA polymerase-3 subunit delta